MAGACFIVGITNCADSLRAVGQREVTVFSRVQGAQTSVSCRDSHEKKRCQIGVVPEVTTSRQTGVPAASAAVIALPRSAFTCIPVAGCTHGAAPPMSDLISRFSALPGYGIGGIFVLLLYAIESEIRFGSRARTMRTGTGDRRSTFAVSLSSAVPLLGFALALKSQSPTPVAWLPSWFRAATMPGLPQVAWIGVLLGVVGLGLRLWAVLTLRDRYTRTLLVHDVHTIERSGPYRWIRHPGYLGSLLCLNGIALASGNWVICVASVAATSAGYSYRIRVEDEMLVRSLGQAYADYRREVRALLPSVRRPHA
jgi:protein-S-isoprenylcysteine O-methyltransferase Ste14